MTDLISRLYRYGKELQVCNEAADEIERLTQALKKANDQAEHFEREWYLRGDEIERLRVDAERYRWLEEHCTSENDNGDKCLVFWCDFENYNDVDAAIDAARAALKEPT